MVARSPRAVVRYVPQAPARRKSAGVSKARFERAEELRKKAVARARAVQAKASSIGAVIDAGASIGAGVLASGAMDAWGLDEMELFGKVIDTRWVTGGRALLAALFMKGKWRMRLALFALGHLAPVVSDFFDDMFTGFITSQES